MASKHLYQVFIGAVGIIPLNDAWAVAHAPAPAAVAAVGSVAGGSLAVTAAAFSTETVIDTVTHLTTSDTTIWDTTIVTADICRSKVRLHSYAVALFRPACERLD